jgi:hypothetical protein
VSANEALEIDPLRQQAKKLATKALHKLMPKKRLMDMADRLWLRARECVQRGAYVEAIRLLNRAERIHHSTKHLMLRAEAHVKADK